MKIVWSLEFFLSVVRNQHSKFCKSVCWSMNRSWWNSLLLIELSCSFNACCFSRHSNGFPFFIGPWWGIRCAKGMPQWVSSASTAFICYACFNLKIWTSPRTSFVTCLPLLLCLLLTLLSLFPFSSRTRFFGSDQTIQKCPSKRPSLAAAYRMLCWTSPTFALILCYLVVDASFAAHKCLKFGQINLGEMDFFVWQFLCVDFGGDFLCAADFGSTYCVGHYFCHSWISKQRTWQ